MRVDVLISTETIGGAPAPAVGAVAIGALAIGRLGVRQARIGRLEVDDLIVRRLQVLERHP